MSNTSTSNNRQTFINGGREWVCLLDGFGPIFTRNCSRNYLCAIKIFLGITLEKIIFFQWYNNSSEFPTRVGNMRRSFCPHFFVQGAASLVKSLSKDCMAPDINDKVLTTLLFAETRLYSRRGDGLRPRVSSSLEAGEELHEAGGASGRDGPHLLE